MISQPRFARHEVVRIRDQRWRVVSHLAFENTDVLEVDGCDVPNRHTRARFLIPHDRPERLPSIGGPRVVRTARWRRIARHALADAVPHVDSLRAAAGVAMATLPYQLEPALAVVRGLASRVLIADEVGLGKTIQAGLCVAEVLQRTVEGHALVVCPASLRDQWHQELTERFGLNAAVLDSSRLSDGVWIGTNPWSAWPVVIASTDYIKRPEVIRALESIVWDAVVLDEAHALSGASDRSNAAGALARRARLVVMLSATPHSGDDVAFSRLCGVGRLPGDPPLVMFRRTRAAAGFSSSRRTHWLRVQSSEDELQLHRALLAYARLVWRQPGSSGGARLAMSVLLKRACSSATALGRSVETRLLLLSQQTDRFDAQLALPFDGASSDDAEPLALLAAPGLSDSAKEQRRLHDLLALASRARQHERKLDVLRRILRRTSEPVIVFTEYRDTLDHIEMALSEYGTVKLHGGLTMRERRETLQAFATGSARVLLATDTASEGLNLHHRCRLVLNMELPWTPLRLEQRIGRVDRIGQRRRVHAVHLVAGGTFEEQTVSRLFDKSARAAVTLSLATAAPDEPLVARMIVEGSTEAPLVSRPQGHICVLDLQDVARAEAERILTARSMKPSGTDSGDPERPALSRRRRTSCSGAPVCCWAFRGDIVDRSGRLLWSTLIGVGAGAPRYRLRSSAAVRALLNPERQALHDAVTRGHTAVLADLRDRLAPWLELSLRREQDLVAEIERTRARLAARQRGLFDRRADRAAFAQSVVLDEAVGRCTERLAYLDRLRVPACGAHGLVFAIALE